METHVPILVITNETKLKFIPASCPQVNLPQELPWYDWINFSPPHCVPDKLLEKVLTNTEMSKITVEGGEPLLENL